MRIVEKRRGDGKERKENKDETQRKTREKKRKILESKKNE
jgi:hypothetical protein